jgi:magnesium-protoporphyrin O-methyltransferase
MPTATYTSRRSELETYFDRTAADAWKKLTSDAPVSKIRATVRAGRNRMRDNLLSWLPHDLSGLRILDAGCGTGALSIEAASRGAHVTAIDLSETLVGYAAGLAREMPLKGRIDFRVGDMLDPALGEFDHIVCMDSLIHYDSRDIVRVLSQLGGRCRSSINFTYAPRTPALAAMHAVGKLFPKSDRAPAIQPVSTSGLRGLIDAEPSLTGWKTGRSERIKSGFYTSHAQELHRA